MRRDGWRPLGVRGGALLAIGLALSGCVRLQGIRAAPLEVPTLVGPPVRDNRTPLDGAFACFASDLARLPSRRPVIAVGDVRDYTGKYSVNEGTAITQGGALMVASALGKLGGAIVMAERFDPTIGERELGYVERRQLGDGQVHSVAGGEGSKVAWLPYYGGSIAASDFYIVGGITELNYNIRSGGGEFRIGQTGPKARTYTQSVAIDLRIVDTRSLLVVHALSLTKQFSGYEVGFNIFRFFGSELFDINLGAKAQEPLQLGIRTALEEATLRLVGAATTRDPALCLATGVGSAAPAGWVGAGPAMSAAAHSADGAVNALAPAAAPPLPILFEAQSERFVAAAGALGARVSAARRLGPVELLLTARASEPADPARRHALADRRIAAVVSLLRGIGVADDMIRLTWRPAASDAQIYREGAGDQRIARLRVAAADRQSEGR
ncbi:hypothetical protein K9B35_00780 [Sphingomonas sp. R647]|uniref:CsgG/HfaB family protein n=1 Tax=Sphingomonas sp. R647 TaxID=2875233 RepID=UPI001CD6DB4B|nr:CsgG/HfaB family protein [Sphingomonas sp. R647]MCA1196491.1 hypothetical protein [Sphingomonas sp. R647]